MNRSSTNLKEPQLITNIIGRIYSDMFTEAADWESAIEKGAREITNSTERFNQYISLGIIDEHTCLFSSLKNFFRLAIESSEEFKKSIKDHQKQIIKLMYMGDYEMKEQPLTEQHKELSRRIENFLSTLTKRMIEYNTIISKTGYTALAVYYSFEF